MSITHGLRAAFAAEGTITAITTDIYCNHLPQDSGLPSILITRTSEDPNNHLGGVGDLRNAYFDIECRGDELEAQSLAAAVITAFADYTGAMGSNSCKAAYYLSSDEDFEYLDDGSDDGQYLTTIQFQFQYT
jgi:hypothetical protein